MFYEATIQYTCDNNAGFEADGIHTKNGEVGTFKWKGSISFEKFENGWVKGYLESH